MEDTLRPLVNFMALWGHLDFIQGRGKEWKIPWNFVCYEVDYFCWITNRGIWFTYIHIWSIPINFRNYVTFIDTAVSTLEGIASLKKVENSVAWRKPKNIPVSQYRRFQINLLTRMLISLELAQGQKHSYTTIIIREKSQIKQNLCFSSQSASSFVTALHR